MEEKYYVACDLDGWSVKIFFNPIDAFVSGFPYLDTFDEGGIYIRTYEFIDNEYIVITR